MFKTIVWATDGSDAANAALPYVKGLAEGDGHKLVVVHCKELMHGRAGGWPIYANEGDLQAKIRGQVDKLRSEGLDVTLRMKTVGAPGAAKVIADAARSFGADVIVVGTHGHTVIGGLLVGSVTQRLLHIAHCPVLAIPAKTAVAHETEPELVETAR
jgi:nucleotide-binding universal stress UspA family protein